MKQRYISVSFWDDEWIQTLKPNEKLIYLYLLTNPLTNIAGVYKITERRICFDTGIDIETIKKTLSIFEKKRKVFKFNEYIIIPTWAKHQGWEKRRNIRDGIIAELQELPEEVIEFLCDVDYQFDLSLIEKILITRKQRQGISGTTIKKLREKYENKCGKCGREENLQIHHIVPIKEGGDNSFDNLILLCDICYKNLQSTPVLSSPHMMRGLKRTEDDMKPSPLQSTYDAWTKKDWKRHETQSSPVHHSLDLDLDLDLDLTPPIPPQEKKSDDKTKNTQNNIKPRGGLSYINKIISTKYRSMIIFNSAVIDHLEKVFSDYGENGLLYILDGLSTMNEKQINNPRFVYKYIDIRKETLADIKSGKLEKTGKKKNDDEKTKRPNHVPPKYNKSFVMTGTDGMEHTWWYSQEPIQKEDGIYHECFKESNNYIQLFSQERINEFLGKNNKNIIIAK